MNTLREFIIKQVATKQLPASDASQYLAQIDDLEIKCSNKTNTSCNEFAVIGMACRFPQANDKEQFWQNLLNRKDAVGPFPRNRMSDVKFVNQHTYDMFKGLNCRVGTYFDSIDSFDHAYFGITPAEVRVMDPSHRIFLEVAIGAIEDAGITEDNLKESKTGVYVGYSVGEDNYIDILPKDDPNVALGNQPSLLAYRLSFLYDLKGPTMIIDTACSASLVALHQACQAINHGDCDQAIVGGVNLRIFPAIREIGNLGIEAYDGRCKSFDEKANGTNIGDGVAAIIIKRKEDAEKDGDHIYALIKGSAINSDGNSNGLTAPNPEAQADVVAKAWENANINPEHLSFIETHGTGTKLGDPIEISGLAHAFKRYTSKKKFCPLGAVKTNIGHLEATSGLAGLIKAVLCLKHRKLPATLHFNKSNPYIDFDNSPVYVNAELKDLENKDGKLLAGISSFGISGTNCHVVVEEYPYEYLSQETSSPLAFVLSAKTAESLKELLKKYPLYLQTNSQYSLSNICYSAATSRNHHDHRICIIANTKQELKEKIDDYLLSLETSKTIQGYDDKGVFYVNLHSHQGWSSAATKQQGTLPSSITSMLNLYFNGQIINWNQFYPSKHQKVPLPTYAFDSKRHWPRLEIEEQFNAEDRLKQVFHTLKWVEKSIPESQVSLPRDRVLFFLHKQPEHEKIFEYCVKNGTDGIKIYPGINFQRISDKEFYINPENGSHYIKLIDAIQEGSQGIEAIIHLWDCMPVIKPMASFDSLQQSQLGTFSSYYIAQTYQKKLIDQPLKFITCTAYAHKVLETDQFIDPTRMPSLGINKVMSQEFPKIQSLAIDIDINHFDPAITPQLIINECFANKTFADAVVAFRNEIRYVQELVRQDIDNLQPRATSIREHGVYLIAGGLGYLGLQTSLLLAHKKHVKIALVGRRAPHLLNEKHQSIFQEIRKLGSEIVYIQGDVTDPNECKAVVQSVNELFGNIHGIFVAIKNISHKRLDVVEFDELSRNILSKIKAIWLLDHLTEQYKPDFMLTFSSISSLTGGPTGADCCASNLFLDSYGDHRNNLKRTTITMNYTLIEADDGSLLSDRLSMIPPLTKEECMQCMEVCLSNELNFAVMADFNSNVMTLVLPFMKVRFSEQLLKEFLGNSNNTELQLSQQTDAPQARSKTSSRNQEMSLNDLHITMKQIWKDVLGYTEIEDNGNFFDIGGDSISAVKLIHLAKVQLQFELSVSDLYSYPGLHDLSHFIFTKTSKNNSSDDLKNLLDKINSGAIDPETALSLL